MSLLKQVVERRTMEDTTVPISSSTILDWLSGGTKTASGKRISPSIALTMIAVYRSVAILAGTGASLPLKTLTKKTRDHVDSELFDNPHPDLTLFEIIELVIAHLALWGNAYLIKRRDGLNRVVELWPLMPDRVTPGRVKPSKALPSGKYFIVNTSERDPSGMLSEGKTEEQVMLTPEDILHVPGLGYDGVRGLSPIAMAREAIAAGLSTEEFANRLWSNGAMVGGVLQTKQKLDAKQAEMLKKRINDKLTGVDQAHSIAVLDAGAEFHQVALPPQDAQFVDTRRFQVAEVARLFGIPPHLLGETDRTTSWGTGIENQNTGFVIYTLRPGYLDRIEARFSKELLATTDMVEFDVTGLLRGDHKTRAAFYQTMMNIKAMTIDEVRERESLPPMTPAQKQEAKPEPAPKAPPAKQEDE